MVISPGPSKWTLYGTQLSPFALKIAASLVSSGIPFVWHWQCSTLSILLIELRLRLLKAGLLTLAVPRGGLSSLDEYPAVPFLFGPGGVNCCDSTAIIQAIADGPSGLRFDHHLSPPSRFLSFLFEEFYDEWGLYLVHHMRWSEPWAALPSSITPGAFLSSEMFGWLCWPSSLFSRLFKTFFNRRQTRRLPYLFSASESTKRLLDKSFKTTVGALELLAIEALRKRRVKPSRPDVVETSLPPSLHFHHPSNNPSPLTSADVSAFGQFGMNALLDVSARAELSRTCPNFLSWLDEMQRAVRRSTGQRSFEGAELTAGGGDDKCWTPRGRSGEEGREGREEGGEGQRMGAEGVRAAASSDDGKLLIFVEICRYFVPLMKANAREHARLLRRGETVFNERAFDCGRSLFEGEFEDEDKSKYTSVVKTFQVKVWTDIVLRFWALTEAEKDELVTWSGKDLRATFRLES